MKKKRQTKKQKCGRRGVCSGNRTARKHRASLLKEDWLTIVVENNHQCLFVDHDKMSSRIVVVPSTKILKSIELKCAVGDEVVSVGELREREYHYVDSRVLSSLHNLAPDDF